MCLPAQSHELRGSKACNYCQASICYKAEVDPTRIHSSLTMKAVFACAVAQRGLRWAKCPCLAAPPAVGYDWDKTSSFLPIPEIGSWLCKHWKSSVRICLRLDLNKLRIFHPLCRAKKHDPFSKAILERRHCQQLQRCYPGPVFLFC